MLARARCCMVASRMLSMPTCWIVSRARRGDGMSEKLGSATARDAVEVFMLEARAKGEL
ncbi:hypothetical protein BKA81DRAFT_350066 [Phyllosticta paracitricarpa]